MDTAGSLWNGFSFFRRNRKENSEGTEWRRIFRGKIRKPILSYIRSITLRRTQFKEAIYFLYNFMNFHIPVPHKDITVGTANHSISEGNDISDLYALSFPKIYIQPIYYRFL